MASTKTWIVIIHSHLVNNVVYGPFATSMEAKEWAEKTKDRYTLCLVCKAE